MNKFKVMFADLNPIWKDGIHVPSTHWLEQIEESFKEHPYDLKVDWIDSERVRIVFQFAKQIVEPFGTYYQQFPQRFQLMKLEITSNKYPDVKEEYYFNFDSIEKILPEGKVAIYKLDYTLQYSCKFMKFMIESWGDTTEMLCLRNPILDKTTTQFDDPLMQELRYTGEYNFEKMSFIMGIENSVRYWQNNKTRISYSVSNPTTDVVNGVMYYVFSDDGTNSGKYLFLPVLSKEKELFYEIYNTRQEILLYSAGVKEKKNGKFYIHDSFGDTNFSYSKYGERDYNQTEFFREMQRLIDSRNYNISIYTGSDFKPIVEDDPNVTLRNIQSCWYQQRDINLFTGEMRVKCDDFYPEYYKTFKKTGASDWSLTYFWFQFTPKGAIWDRYTIQNSYKEINKIKDSQEFSNKFVGVVFLPNVLLMEDKLVRKNISYTPKNESRVTKQFLTLDLRVEGDFIKKRLWINGSYPSNPTITPDNIINNWYLMKYHKCRYYNNDIDLSHYYDFDTQSFVTKGYFNFTGNGNYVDKVATKPISECIIEYPYQLPSTTDRYQQYVSGIYNTTNTSANIAKQQMELGIVGNIISSVLGIGFGAATGGIGSILTGGVGLAGNLIKNSMGYNNQMKMLSAQFADARNRIGNTINNSLIQDAAWMNYYLKDNEQYSGIERFFGDENFNKQLYNILDFYNYYSPRYLTWKKIDSFKSKHQSFFIQVDEKWLSANLMVYYLQMDNNYDPNNNGYNYIYNQLLNGIRITNFRAN